MNSVLKDYDLNFPIIRINNNFDEVNLFLENQSNSTLIVINERYDPLNCDKSMNFIRHLEKRNELEKINFVIQFENVQILKINEPNNSNKFENKYKNQITYLCYENVFRMLNII